MRDWESLDVKNRGIITVSQIPFLLTLREKSLRGGSLGPAQRTMKSEIHQEVGRAIRDIIILINLGFIRPDNRQGIKPDFKESMWKEEIPSNRLSVIVQTMVEMFGEEYAIPLARAIEEGLRKKYGNKDHIEVPVIRKAYAPATEYMSVEKVAGGKDKKKKKE